MRIIYLDLDFFCKLTKKQRLDFRDEAGVYFLLIGYLLLFNRSLLLLNFAIKTIEQCLHFRTKYSVKDNSSLLNFVAAFSAC